MATAAPSTTTAIATNKIVMVSQRQAASIVKPSSSAVNLMNKPGKTRARSRTTARKPARATTPTGTLMKSGA